MVYPLIWAEDLEDRLTSVSFIQKERNTWTVYSRLHCRGARGNQRNEVREPSNVAYNGAVFDMISRQSGIEMNLDFIRH